MSAALKLMLALASSGTTLQVQGSGCTANDSESLASPGTGPVVTCCDLGFRVEDSERAM